MTCKQCNQILPDDSEFCPYCGTKIQKEIPEPEPVPVTPETAPTDQPYLETNDCCLPSAPAPAKQKSPKEPKRKYCSRCGSLIDRETRQCTGCGKQYFKWDKFNTFVSILLLINIGLIILAVIQFLHIAALTERLELKSYLLNKYL